MAKLLKRYSVVYGELGGELESRLDGEFLDRSEVVAAVRRRIRTERERKTSSVYEAGIQQGAAVALEALLARLGVKP